MVTPLLEFCNIIILLHVLWQTPHTGMFDTVCMERIQPFDDPIPPDDEEEVSIAFVNVYY